MIRIILLLIGTSTLSVTQHVGCDPYESCLYDTCGYMCTYNMVAVDDASTGLVFYNSYSYVRIVRFLYSHLIEIPKKIFEAFSQIQLLDVSYSGIEVINRYSFERASSLKQLNVSSNNLEELKNYIFSGATNLEELDLSNNDISDIEEKAFQNKIALQKLLLSGNKLKSLRDDVFSSLTSLKELSLARNELIILQNGLFGKNTLLQRIFLDNNQLTTLDENLFNGISEIKELAIHNNNLTSLDFNNTKVKLVNVINNQIKVLKLSSSLQVLYASNNDITELVADSFEALSLKTLSLARNNITSLDGIDQIDSLEVLDVSHNTIGALNLTSFAKLINLVDLALEDTKITNLQHGTFSHLFLLKRLDISYNNQNQIDLDIFASSHHLDELYVDGNRLKEINYEEIPKSFPLLRKVSIADNNWNCSYLIRMIRSLKSHSVEVRGFKSKNLVADKSNVKGIHCTDTKNSPVEWNETAKHLDKYLNDSVPIVDTSEIKQIMQKAIDDIRNFNDQKQLFTNKTDRIEGEIYDLTKKVISLENEIYEIKKSILDLKMTQLANATNETFISTDLKKMMQELNDLTLSKLNLTAESLTFKMYQLGFKFDRIIEKVNENADKLLLVNKQMPQRPTQLHYDAIQQEPLRTTTASTSGSGASNVIMTLILVVLIALLVIVVVSVVLVVVYRNRLLTAFGGRRGAEYKTSSTLATIMDDNDL